MNAINVSSIVKEQVAQTCAVPVNDVKEETNLIEYGLDSVRSMDLIVALETQFDIDIGDANIADLRTVGDVIQIIERTLNR